MYERYVEWKNRWVSESRCAPFLRLFILDQLLPFWIDCSICGKFRLVERAQIQDICSKKIKNFNCSQVFPETQDPCKIVEEKVILLIKNFF